MGRIAQVIDLHHAHGAPIGHAGNQVGNAGVAFPPALVSVAEVAADHRDCGLAWRDRSHRRFRGRSSVAAQKKEFALVRVRQIRCRRAPFARRRIRLGLADARGSPGMCARYFGWLGSVTSRIEVPLISSLPRQRVHDLPGVMADVGDVTVALLFDGRLIGAAACKSL